MLEIHMQDGKTKTETDKVHLYEKEEERFGPAADKCSFRIRYAVTTAALHVEHTQTITNTTKAATQTTLHP